MLSTDDFRLRMCSNPLEILYDQGPCLVVNKPPGLLTQAPRGIDSLEIRVKQFYRRREGKKPDANISLGLAHRLDRPVTGAIVFARLARPGHVDKPFAQTSRNGPGRGR